MKNAISRIYIAAAIAVLAFTAHTQEPAKPADEMKRFDAMVGNWEGSGGGTTPTGAPMKWTGKSTIQRVLGGHFVQEDVQIVVEGIGAIAMRQLYGWDAARKRYWSLMLSDMHSPVEGAIWWVGDRRTVQTNTMRDHQGINSERWVIDYEDDMMKVRCMTSIDGKDAHVHVEGTFSRGGEGFQRTPENATKTVMAPRDEMTAMKPYCGDWTCKGTYRMPDGKEIALNGKETIALDFGGHALVGRSTFDLPNGPVAGHAYGYFSAQRGCYRWVVANAAGEVHRMDGSVAKDGAWTWFTTGPKPGASRMSISFDGDTMKMTEHHLGKTGGLVQKFDGAFTRAKS